MYAPGFEKVVWEAGKTLRGITETRLRDWRLSAKAAPLDTNKLMRWSKNELIMRVPRRPHAFAHEPGRAQKHSEPPVLQRGNPRDKTMLESGSAQWSGNA